ncbi:hypothetical protein SynSYN20_01269 [Synechococcus sp. SYN20]|nr:hypothetical protein SynSYN20_01269 [Synechococcus sp. SYN20]
MAIAVASDIGKVWTHLAPWIKGFGLQFEVTPVVSDKEFQPCGLEFKLLPPLTANRKDHGLHPFE